MKKIYASIIVMVFALSMNATAQVNYSFSATNATYVPVTGGITPPLINRPYDFGGKFSYPYDEGIANSIPIGFIFNYNGINYNSVNICANGFATLGSPFLTDLNDVENFYINTLKYGPLFYQYSDTFRIIEQNAKPVLAPLWDDLNLQANSNLRYLTTGTTGSHVFTFEWSQVLWQYNASSTTLSFELKLYEGTNIIEFCYKDEGGSSSTSASASIGITANNIMGGGFMSLQNTSGSPTVSTTIETNDLYKKPADNQVYRFTPLPCNLPSNLHYESYTNHAVTIAWNAAEGGSTYEYAATTSITPPASGVSTSLTQGTVSSLIPNTKYYIHVRSVCSASSQSVWLTDSIMTANNPVTLPYSEDFENGDPNLSFDFPENFRQQDFNDTLPEYNSYYSWESRADIPEYAHTGSQFIIHLDEPFKADDWFYLPGFNLTAGNTYKLKFYYAAPFSDFNPNKLEIKYGQAIGAIAMTSGTLFNHTDINNIDYLEDSSLITPLASGLYFIGFHCYSDSAKGIISIDDISLEKTNILPVTLVNFSGEVNGKENLLHWTTATEQNNTGFEVQRSIDGINFSKIGFVNTKAINGNSNLKLNYDLSDIGYAAATNYYRLKQIDKDGKFNYSNIVVLKDENAIANGSIEVYPNPVKNSLSIKIASNNSRSIQLSVTDISGKSILNKSALVNNGETIVQLDVSHLLTGTYFIKLISTDGSEETIKKFVKE